FQIWQRGTSQTAVLYGSVDRWNLWYGGGETASLSRQTFTAGTVLGKNNPKYYMRFGVVGTANANGLAIAAQRIEDVRSYAGQTITVLGWARRASGSGSVSVEMEQIFGTGGSPSSGVNEIGSTKVALTTDFEPFAVQIAVPSITGKTIGMTTPGYINLMFWGSGGSDYDSRTDSLGNQTIEIDLWGVHIRLGEHTTDACDEYFAPSEAAELADCRWYYRTNEERSGAMNESNTYATFGVPERFGMRTTPTVTVVNSAGVILRPGVSSYNISSISPSGAYVNIYPSTMAGAEKPLVLIGGALGYDAEL
ncbi:MAG: hypothetical protein KDK89_22625, partial [Alphaproteobacteria bacterium]|nr:hypothetical protein [Alphaproteobacteria bacterium]